MVLMTAVELADVDLSGVESAVGPRSFARGRAFARGGRVAVVEWDAEDATLRGSVAGNGGLYDAAASFAGDPGAPLEFLDGECTCPVGWNCKHVAALVIAARAGRATTSTERALRAPVAERPPWEAPLRALITQPALQERGNPLAIELALRVTGVAGAVRLMARLMRPGARGGWINGSLAWNELEWQVHQAGLRPDHVELARELFAAQRLRRIGAGYYSGYGADKTIDLSDCGARLWSILDEARRIGVSLIHAGKVPGEVGRPMHGEIVIDVTRQAGGDSRVAPVLRIDGEDAGAPRPVLFLGTDGHGLVCADAAAGADIPRSRLRLVRLERPAPAPLQRMVLDGGPLTIAIDDLDRFAAEICPGLRSVAPVVSSDGSFAPPEVSGPSLVLHARFGGGHTAELAWAWKYGVGDGIRSTPLGIDGAFAGFRDRAAEREILAEAFLEEPGLERLGLVDGAGRPTETPALITGLDTMRLATEQLPRLREASGIEVEVQDEPADYRDVADTLEIGVSTVEIPGERDWFDLGVSIRVDDRELPFADVFVALANGQSHMLLDDGAHFSLAEPRLQSLRTLIDEARSLADSAPRGLRISRWQAGLWGELAALGVVTEQAQAWQRQTRALLELDELPAHTPPATLRADMRPYQRDGFAWLASLWDLQLGGILADDMGLGKTLQTLALICHARDRDPSCGPFLVVAPTSVVSNWVAEAAHFAPSLAVEGVTDTLTKSGRSVSEIARSDVVVMTYTLLRLDADAYRSVEWAGVILDEAQAVKNHHSKTYRCVREIASPFKLALTGTPMENNVMELWSLLSITAPGLFPDPKRFAEHYARPIERGGDGEQLARLRRRIKPLVKRRTKELVAAELPAKQEQMLEVDLHPRHRKIYETHLQRERQKVLHLLGDFDRNRFTILRSITLLRQLSLHPDLVDHRVDRIPSAKLGALAEHLREIIDGGHRALVFSQFTGFLAKVRDRLDEEGMQYCYLDGSTRRRAQVIDRFKRGTDPVFLISLKAGGIGLNLTEADYCFLLDPWWNPATERQAIDRINRIGQSRPVMVYRMIARDTIEEKVVALASRKAALFRGVMDDGDLFASRLTADDIRGLLE